MAWDRMIAKYAPELTLTMLKLKTGFENNKFENVEKDS